MGVVDSFKRYKVRGSFGNGRVERSDMDETVAFFLRDIERQLEILKKQFYGIDLERSRIELIKQKYDAAIKDLHDSSVDRMNRLEENVRKLEETNRQMLEHESAFKTLIEKAIMSIVEKNEAICELRAENERLKSCSQNGMSNSETEKNFPTNSSIGILSEFISNLKKTEKRNNAE